MTDTEKLKQKIQESGLIKGFIADKCGMSYASFLNKLNNKTDFTAPEISALKNLLHLELQEVEDIFFAHKVDNTSTKEEA